MKKMTALLLVLCMVLSLVPFTAFAADAPIKDGKTYIVITPAVFSDKAGWSHTSDKDQAQSFGYMLGGKKGTPVTENPSVDVEIPKDGTYKIYVLGKDSTSAPGTRYFDVVLGDVTYRTGNHGQNGFCWQSSGELQATAGKTTLTLTDVSGNYSRCAAIVITDDLTFAPGSDNEAVAALSKIKYKPDEIQTTKKATIQGEANAEGEVIAPTEPAKPSASGSAVGKADFGDGKNYVVVMPHAFKDLKDWSLTKDKTDEQSYSYLIGGKAGVTAEKNPSVEVILPEDGTYKIYALSKDSNEGAGSRYYDIVLGEFAYRTGNHGQKGFSWQSSEPIEVTAGKTTLSVMDVSGNYSRCAAIVITDNLSFNPGADNESVAAIAEKANVKASAADVKDATVTGVSTGELPGAVRDKNVAPYALKADKTYMVFDTTSFKDLGDWKIETADGVTYLVGGANENPAQNNPAIQIVLPKDATYKFYAYTKDYARNKAGSRHFEAVLGDGIVSERLGNHGKNGFEWQKSEAFTVFGGEMALTLKDTSGNQPRVAMLVITDDLDFDPKCNDRQMTALKEKLYKAGDYTYTKGDVTGRPASEIAVRLNGEWMQFDVDPILMNDRTMVPFRAIFEALGCTVSWDDVNQTAIGMRNGQKIVLPIGSLNVSVNNVAKVLDQPAVLKDGRTLVPLRFVSESLGAQVEWFEDTQTVAISASVPTEKVFLTFESFVDMGTWVREIKSTDAFNDQAMKGTKPAGTQSTPEDADPSNTRPAIANIDVNGGTYYVWGHAKDFSTNAQGSRFMNVGFDDMPMMENRMGDHGKQGYVWELLGTVDLTRGRHKLKVYDTSGYYARFDGILLTTDSEYVPAESYELIVQDVVPVSGAADIKFPFPGYANEQGVPTESYSIENDKTKVVFYKVPTSNGQVVQREIYSKSNGSWVKTTGRNEDLGYYVVRADKASYAEVRDLLNMQTTFTYGGETIEGSTTNPYVAGVGKWFVPTDYTVDGNKVILSCASNEYGTLTATWSLDDNTAPLVSVDVSFAQDGYYTVGVHEGKGFLYEGFEHALAPFRVAYKRVSEKPQLYTESYLFTPMGAHTLYANNEYAALPVTKGVVAEPSWIPVRWVYENNNLFGITMNDASNMHQAALFAPVLGSAESKMTAGQNYNVQVRMISTVADWFANYEDTVTNLFDVTDYRKNYVVSLNQAIFNTRKTALDDKYSGWDVYDKAYYNMENGNRTSNANGMQALQDYLLTEDMEMLEKRTIPSVANALTRGSFHFNRVGTSDEDGFEKVSNPSAIGSPIANFNANVWGGMYEMSRGMMPFLHQQTLLKGQQAVTNSASSSIAPFVNDLYMYKYSGDKQYLDKAIAGADKYLEESVYAENAEMPVWTTFIWVSYYPNLGSLMDIYEITGDKKYLDAAEKTAQWMSTAFWVPGVDGTRKTDKIIMVNDWETMKKDNWIAKQETTRTYWWAGDKQMRIGREENLAENPESLKNITDRTRLEEGWLASRTGLGIEQASTFKNGLNIIMQSFAGDFLKLSAYTGNDYYATLAKNTIIGRFSNYDGYYRTCYTTYQQEINYPVEGPDYTGIYWHHIPPFLAMLEDFLINQTFASSNQNIHFPSLRQNGYAYFNSNQYGHAPGKFYEEEGMWPWLAEDTVLPDSIQINWMAARKDGVMGVAFMNEDHVDTTTTVSLGAKVPGGANYSGTAVLYDENGKIGTVEVANGKFTLTVPAKGFRAVKLNIPEVKAPAFASMDYSATSATLGATVSEHTNGKGYTLQLSPEFYYAYVYTTTNQRKIQSATLTYTVNGETKTETATVYPFEFIVKVDDPDAEFTYTISETDLEGKVTELGGGTLMTAALSAKKGIKEPVVVEIEKEVPVPEVKPTAAAKALKFDPTPVTCKSQGSSKTGELRFVIEKEGMPFEANADNVVGLTISGVINITANGKQEKFKSRILGFEDRNSTQIILVVAPTEAIHAQNYGATSSGRYSWSDVVLSPVE
ncbi:MAG: hypothetical protein IJE10_10095 [Clostridia bacterium]|nr:hypothetical protein [Clostridia bacterium]